MHIRAATVTDLAAVNAIIEACVMAWDLPERVKRLSLDSYRYDEHDLAQFDIFVAIDDRGEVIGVAALGQADARDLPAEQTGLLLYGIYVMPTRQRGGVGMLLLRHALEQARNRGMDGLLVKAQVDANRYFAAKGFTSLPVADPVRDYPHRWWKTVIP